MAARIYWARATPQRKEPAWAFSRDAILCGNPAMTIFDKVRPTAACFTSPSGETP